MNPATNQVIARLANSNEADIDEAVKSAEAAFPAWSSLAASKRAEYLIKIADALQERVEEFALLESRDQGKTLMAARGLDVPATAASIKNAAGYAQYVDDSSLINGNRLHYIQRVPLGVTGAITPWNYPLIMVGAKMANSIIYGNCVVMKPSEVTPMTAYLLTDVLLQVGLPKGVVNIVHGTGRSAGSALVKHPRVRAISFTGGTETGRIVNAQSSANIKKVGLELGGKNPTVVCDDCDLESTVKMAAMAAFGNTGQICICGSRIFVHKKVMDEFVEKLKKECESTYIANVGNPLTAKYGGCLSSQMHRDKVEKYIELAKTEGGKIICGGKRPSNLEKGLENGAFLEPTIILGLDAETSKCATEEMFGPVVTVHPWDSEEVLLKQINGIEYGLSASVWTKDLKRAHQLAHKIQSGAVWVNCWAPQIACLGGLRPFGGHKQSGNGQDNGRASYEFYTDLKNICINFN